MTPSSSNVQREGWGCIVFVSWPRPLRKVNISPFLRLILKLSPSNLLFSRLFKVIAGRKVSSPADFLWI